MQTDSAGSHFFFFFFSFTKLYVYMPAQWVGRAETIETLFPGESCDAVMRNNKEEGVVD